jgi:beta-xylosidase
VLPGDFSDIDAIRVGTHFYAITSTFQYSPGMAILQSEDLLHWTIVGHVVDDLTRISPALNWNRMDRSGRGIWAGAIRFHAGRFWVYFGTPDEGLFMASAPAIAGPWTPVVPVLAESGWDDPCPFWDDDGQLYLVTTHYKPEANGKSYNIHLFKLSRNGEQLLKGSDRIIHQSRGSEANKLYKINGFYFHYYSEVAPEGRVVMMERSKSLDGPWETKQLIHVHASVDKEPNQGGLIELEDGRWYFLSHQGRGDWEGRAGVLLPVTWIANWPIVGAPGPDGIGNMVWRGADPLPTHARVGPAVSDDFSAPTLNPAWEWNYQPRAEKWSLRQRPGFLRLEAFPPLRPNDFESTGNVLTQRAYRTKANQFTAKLDISGMVSGQEAGVAHYAKTRSILSVVQQGTTRTLTLDGTPGPILTGPTLWLRSTWGFEGLSQWSYSVDGKTFTNIGDLYQLTWAHYRGDRLGLFTVNQSSEAGCLDIDSVTYTLSQP